MEFVWQKVTTRLSVFARRRLKESIARTVYKVLFKIEKKIYIFLKIFIELKQNLIVNNVLMAAFVFT